MEELQRNLQDNDQNRYVPRGPELEGEELNAYYEAVDATIPEFDFLVMGLPDVSNKYDQQRGIVTFRAVPMGKLEELGKYVYVQPSIWYSQAGLHYYLYCYIFDKEVRLRNGRPEGSRSATTYSYYISNIEHPTTTDRDRILPFRKMLGAVDAKLQEQSQGT